ncbi:putative bifunctional diguanylate cyclase/phosphodiesterase [Marinobacter sp.]|uniref:putative bifunctional diguanylate cyclase/phosphodiesterase n=1 Tax=Marinobacter sp. TaxID=50741 RepID=UPI00384A697E
MNLAQFIETEMERLLEDWEAAALEIAPELKGEDTAALRDHAREMLDFVARDVLRPQTSQETIRKSVGKFETPASAAGKHGHGRLELGLSLTQVLQELRALRASVTRLWTDEQQGLATKDIAELVRFNEAIDQLITNSVASYSSRKEQETRLFEAMLEVSPDPSAIFDPAGRLLYLNGPMAELVSTPAGDAEGKTPLELGLGFATGLLDAIADTVNTGQAQRREFHCHLPLGRDLYFDSQLAPVYDEQHEIEAVVKTSRDITERKHAEHQIWKSANLDSLTGVPNRRLFLDRLEQNLREAERKDNSFALLFIDLDRFKQANDQLGHKAGDRLLKQVAERISGSVRAMDTVARLGGDEFTVILKDTSGKDAQKAAGAVLDSLEQPFEIDSRRVNISGSIGITLFPDDGTDADELMHHADQAMYAAKESGGHQLQLYQPSMEKSESEHMRLSRELDDAMREHQLEMYYQPIVDTHTGRICRAEALLRWNHPERGLLSPAAFLTIAEQSGMAESISAWVLEQAAACSLKWGNDREGAFPVNINESPASFFTPSLVDQWGLRLTESDLGRSRITMELAPECLANLHASGFSPVNSFGQEGWQFKLAIDEFGIEPFSMVALRECKVSIIKVDRALVSDAGQNREAGPILSAIMNMAHAMNIRVVAEGVEKDEQLQFLKRIDCDYAQGFLFSPPLPRSDFEKLLTQRQ